MPVFSQSSPPAVCCTSPQSCFPSVVVSLKKGPCIFGWLMLLIDDMLCNSSSKPTIPILGQTNAVLFRCFLYDLLPLAC